jgi:hypothetical protein
MPSQTTSIVKGAFARRHWAALDSICLRPLVDLVAARAGVLLGLAFVACVSWSPTAGAQCSPTADQVAYFEHSNFQGKCRIRGAGSLPKAADMGLPNDSISSIKVGTNVQALVCEDTFFEGQCELLKGNDSNLGNNKIGHDRISSGKVQPRGQSVSCVPRQTEVAFFRHSNFEGVSCEVRAIGNYRTSSDIGLRNDSISSIRVGSEVQAILCRDTSFLGTCQLFERDDLNLGNDKIGHDEVSSARVQNLGHRDCVPGADQVGLFMHTAFLSPCVVKDMGEYENSEEIGLANDSASSVRVGDNVQVQLCQDTRFRGNCKTLEANQSNLGNIDGVDHDAVSSLKVQPRGFRPCLPTADQVSFYMHSGFLEPCEAKGVGDYANASELDIEDISSIRVGANVQACVCPDDDFRGNCELFTADDSNLGNNSIGHDRISSARVQARGDDCTQETRRVSLGRKVPDTGPILYTGAFPTTGILMTGRLKAIRFPHTFTKPTFLHFPKAGIAPQFCGDPMKVVVLGEDEETTPMEVEQIFGQEEPLFGPERLIDFIACVTSSEPVTSPSIEIEITILLE